ncbi:hypothetical protein F7230_04930 [Corynebacterium sp. 320]|uniref:Transmembrane protein n=1 Tax=Corynebacterium zhongnanshanii TaxID=2768834 RepID=A0ABQ6VEC2_9CORY|nr:MULTISPECIES: hypothetical protein [Corynebacterium]KAB1504413.1 hypothetical protein F7230_04930 [Corynebacterium sp. 320]KAB1552488.1 hypothetical protein F7233_01670 [Corynebacterium sp. 321]KAB1554297.1 hypothetical protein F7232_04930 [Corynebacterium sp. 319]KAB3522730.1 hypothetical protein F8377_00665 [Corynebacterium zhongnanshanii]KAB3528549.1 hypothetical protein F8354_04930 [Corynebacterium sp. 250]
MSKSLTRNGNQMNHHTLSVFKNSRVPEHLTAASVFSAATGLVGVVHTAISYTHYTKVPGDEQVHMNIPITGLALGLFFASFILFAVGLWFGKTWSYSALVLTNVILTIITFTIFKGGQIPLGLVFTFIVLNFYYFLFCKESLNWYKQAYYERMYGPVEQ